MLQASSDLVQLLDSESDFWERAVRIKDLPSSHGICMESRAQTFSWTELGRDFKPYFSNLLPRSPTLPQDLPRCCCLSWPVATLSPAQQDLLGHDETTLSWGKQGKVVICVALGMSQVSTAVSINLRALTNIFLSRRDKMWPAPFPKHQNEPWTVFVYSTK